jgi:hypothetical protein
MQTSAQPTTRHDDSSANSPIQGIERDLMQDLAAFARSGAFDAPECYRSAIAAMAVNHRLTLKQSRNLFHTFA